MSDQPPFTIEVIVLIRAVSASVYPFAFVNAPRNALVNDLNNQHFLFWKQQNE